MGALSSIAWTLLIGLLGSGCAGATGTFRANGFHHDSLPIVVHYRDASAHTDYPQSKALGRPPR